jgi:hypothetical protein
VRPAEFRYSGDRLPGGNPEFEKQTFAIDQAQRMCKQMQN